MPTDDSFLAAVAAAPADLVVRLVYADWLDERSDPRGECIRLSCALAALTRRPTKKREGCEERFTQVRTGIDPHWRIAVGMTFDADAWEKALSPLNSALDNINWTQKAVREQPGGVYQKSQAVLLRLLVTYELVSTIERTEVRGLVPEYSTFFGATCSPSSDTPTESLRRELIRFALLDQYPDPRDAVLWLDEFANSPGVRLRQVAALRREIAPLASTRNRYGFGSTRSLLLKGYGSGYGRRGAPARMGE